MKKVNNLLLKIIMIVMIFSLMLSINNPKTFADVGDFETYDDWGSSSWDSDWGSSWDDDWGSSSWDSSWDSDWDDYSYSGSGSGIDLFDFMLGMLFSGNKQAFFVLLIFIIISACTRSSRKRASRADWYRRQNAQRMREERFRDMYARQNLYKNNPSNNYDETGYFTTRNNAITNSASIEQEILKTDELFNREEFESWVKQIFIKLQYAWTDRDWTEIRPFETNELFEQHNTQLNRYIMKKQINVLDRVAVNWVKLHKFYKTTEKEVLEVVLNSKMIDYIIDEETKNVVAGDTTTSKIRNYKLTFIRTLGVKTKPRKNHSSCNELSKLWRTIINNTSWKMRILWKYCCSR